MGNKLIAAAALLICVAITAFILLKDIKKHPDLRAFRCSGQESMRFKKSRGFAIYLSSKRITFLKREAVVAVLLIVSLIFTVIIRSRRNSFDSQCIASLIPAAVFLTVMLFYAVMFFLKDPVAVTLGKAGELSVIKGKDGKAGRMKASVMLRSGQYIDAFFPGLKTGKAGNEENIRPGEICFVFVTSDGEILLAADRRRAESGNAGDDAPQPIEIANL